MKYLLFGLMFAVCMENVQTASAQPYTEYELKAAYLINFGKFVSWPENINGKSGEFIVGIYGNNPFGTILDETIASKTLQGCKIKVIFCENAEQAKLCHILFVSDIGNAQIVSLLKALNGLPVLTVGDQLENFCEYGGIVNFTPQNHNKRFEINNTAAQRCKLQINSKLLALAKIITEDEIKF